MKTTKMLAAMLLGAAGWLASGIASAAPITIAPTVPPSVIAPACTGPGTGSDPAWIAANCPAMVGFTEYYKQNQGGAEEGTLAGSYSSSFNGDLSGGTITYTGGNAIDCQPLGCWLLVKDGSATPGRYAFDLSTVWDGVSTITLSGFWPGSDQGAISHWALYGKAVCRPGDPNCTPVQAPEPGSLALVGLAILGAGLVSRRRRQA